MVLSRQVDDRPYIILDSNNRDKAGMKSRSPSAVSGSNKKHELWQTLESTKINVEIMNAVKLQYNQYNTKIKIKNK